MPAVFQQNLYRTVSVIILIVAIKGLEPRLREIICSSNATWYKGYLKMLFNKRIESRIPYYLRVYRIKLTAF